MSVRSWCALWTVWLVTWATRTDVTRVSVLTRARSVTHHINLCNLLGGKIDHRGTNTIGTLLIDGWVELSWIKSGYLYAAPNSLMSHNGAGRWFTQTGKAESSAGAWRWSVTVRGRVAKEVDCSRLRGRTPRSSAGQWKSKLWTREGFQKG